MRWLLLALLCSSLSLFGQYKCDSQGYIRDWLIGGPFPNYQTEGKQAGFVDDFLISLGGEALAEPYAGLKENIVFKADKARLIAGIGSTNEWGFTSNRTFETSWKKVHWTNKSPIVRLNKMFSPIEDYHVTYAFCYVYSPVSQPVKIRVGSDDDNKIWLNDKLTGMANSAQGVVPDNFIYIGRLKKGLNRLLVKIVERTHGHGFCLALSGMDNKPLQDIKIILDDPKRKLLKEVKGLRLVSCWDDGFFAGFIFDKKYVFKGDNKCLIQMGTPLPGRYSVQLTVKKLDKTIAVRKKTVDLKVNQCYNWDINLMLPDGNIDFELSFNKSSIKFYYTVVVYNVEKLRGDSKSHLTQIEQYSQDIVHIKNENKRYIHQIQQIKQDKNKLYEQIEEAYLKERLKVKTTGGRVCNEPVIFDKTDRTKICLNGDQWLGAIGQSPANWHTVRLPITNRIKHFRTSYYPVENVGSDTSGKVKSLKGWKDYVFDPIINADNCWFKTTVFLPEHIDNKVYSLIFENVSGKLTVFLNDRECGKYFGNIGIVDIPLKDIRPGKNVISMYLKSPESCGIYESRFDQKWGIMGDIYLMSYNNVNVADITIKTSWRSANISVSSEIKNNTNSKVSAEIKQYCVLDNKIKYRFPSKFIEINPHSKAQIKSAGTWPNATIWGIGGKYGEPVLYEMVSDLYMGGKLIDRKITPFGFREFWIAGYDFYLNGKRIILQGDTGMKWLANRKASDVLWPLLRADGINILRSHNGDYWSPEFLRTCDERGMLAYVQMYPVLHASRKSAKGSNYLSYKQWLEHPLHQYNLDNYRRWVKMLRNHPSVVIASTDNEIFTQAWDTPGKLDFNIRNDQIGAIYEKYVKSIDPSLVLTRNGDEGTWGKSGKWQETPPCDTANYHYPEFNLHQLLDNWHSRYGFRPLILGETLYCSYGAWDEWIGPIPGQVTMKADKVRRIASFYCDHEIPSQIYMGLSHDGFSQFDNTGQGNPWGITSDMFKEYNKNRFLPEFPRFPWAKVKWPSMSGIGLRRIAQKRFVNRYGSDVLNWYDDDYPSHIRNKVNDAYRDTLMPQQPLAPARGAECLINTSSNAMVIAEPIDCLGILRGVVADKNGVAWIHLPSVGTYRFRVGEKSVTCNVPARKKYSDLPGFSRIPEFKLK